LRGEKGAIREVLALRRERETRAIPQNVCTNDARLAIGQGKVQVKRIEFSDGGVPVVIVSENGQEVVKMVGSSRNTIAGSFGWTN